MRLLAGVALTDNRDAQELGVVRRPAAVWRQVYSATHDACCQVRFAMPAHLH